MAPYLTFLAAVSLAAFSACGGTGNGNPELDGGGNPDGNIVPDAAAGDDSGPGVDAGAGTDASSGPDAGVTGTCAGSVPLVYNAPTDRLPHQATPPTLGDAGSFWTDPVYGTKVLRLTDVNTVPGSTRSYQVANEFWGNDWNTDATLFYVEASGGGLLAYRFDPKSMTASRVMDKTQPTKPLSLPVYSGGFSRTDPNVLYGMKGTSFAQFDFSTQTTTSLVDAYGFVPDAGGYALGVQQGTNGLLVGSFGGPQQDKMPYIVTWDPATGVHHVLDVRSSTLDGTASGANIGAVSGGVHTFKLDKSGRYIAFSVAGGTASDWLWDTTTNAIASVPTLGSIGSGSFVHHGTGDSYQWSLTAFSAPTVNTALIAPLLSPTDNLASSSMDWMNAPPGELAPIIADTMRQPSDTGPWRAWDDEVIAVRTDGQSPPLDGGVAETEVWRFAHTFNTYSGTVYSDNFYYLFIPRVSQNGWFVLFDSNWNQTLGTDPSGNPRMDVFIAALPNPCGP